MFNQPITLQQPNAFSLLSADLREEVLRVSEAIAGGGAVEKKEKRKKNAWTLLPCKGKA